MKHLEATPWCADTEEIINAANYVSSRNKEILNSIKHIDSQIGESDIRVQGIISKDDFFNLLSEIREFNGTLKARDSKNIILEIYLKTKSKIK